MLVKRQDFDLNFFCLCASEGIDDTFLYSVHQFSLVSVMELLELNSDLQTQIQSGVLALCQNLELLNVIEIV